jgi:hypothetical protein
MRKKIPLSKCDNERNHRTRPCRRQTVLVTLLWSAFVLWTQWRVLVQVHDDSGTTSLGAFVSRNISSLGKKGDYSKLRIDGGGGSGGPIRMNEIIHRAFFGLGHRLHRSAAAWHLAKSLGNVTHFRFHWESCQAVVPNENAENNDTTVDYNVFRYLFENDVWKLPSDMVVPTTFRTSSKTRKMIVLRNDVHGYIKGQLYKDLQLSVPASPAGRHMFFDDKLQSDVSFYQLLESQYRFHSEVENFMQEHQFQNRLVIGLHIRAGNGEGMHFEATGRGVRNASAFVDNLVLVVGEMLSYQTVQEKLFPPIVFLATDTAYLIPLVQDVSKRYLNIETVVLPQLRLEANQGVTFDNLEGTGRKCLDGWQAMVSDMILLSHADFLIAAKHSTFTQSLPLSLIFHRRKTFCEVSENGMTMTCISGRIEAWLFRDDPSRIHTYAVVKDTTKSPPGDVAHPITVLLPDNVLPVEFALAQEYLRQPWEDPVHESIFAYGQTKIFKKYRGTKLETESRWNFAE